MNFYVGQKVACVPEAPFALSAIHPGAIYPIPNVAYTVRSIEEYRNGWLLMLVEIDNGHLQRPLEPGFNAKYFRPVVERKTDISIFTKILDDANAGRKLPADTAVQ